MTDPYARPRLARTSRPHHAASSFAALQVTLLLAGGAVGGCAHVGGGGPVAEVRGTLVYEARSPTFRGVSRAIELRPCRLVTVVALAPDGTERGHASTDALGRYAIEVRGAVARVVVRTAVEADGYDLRVVRDEAGTEPYEFPVRGGADEPTVLRDDTPLGEGGAMHLLDTLLRGEEAVRDLVGARLPPLHATWGRGLTTEWSFYVGEHPEGSGRFRMELLGGQPGRRTSTDTDEHDEAVVLHELGHFVFDRLATASSAGGQHPSGHYVDPGLAWEEGRATWFAAIVLGRSTYTDSIGVEPHGSLQVHTDLEGRNPPPRGLGSQETVEEILWDLTDGGDGPADRDGDGVSVPPARILREMIALRDDPGAYPCLPTFVAHLVRRGVVDESGLRAVLATGSLPATLLALDGEAPWPIGLALGREVVGRIDSITEPAPSGGPRLPRTGYDAVVTYRFALPRPARVALRLVIDGQGDERDRTDLDVELLDGHAELLTASRGTTSEERIERSLAAGAYVVRVVDGGQDGARARFTLRVREVDPP